MSVGADGCNQVLSHVCRSKLPGWRLQIHQCLGRCISHKHPTTQQVPTLRSRCLPYTAGAWLMPDADSDRPGIVIGLGEVSLTWQHNPACSEVVVLQIVMPVQMSRPFLKSYVCQPWLHLSCIYQEKSCSSVAHDKASTILTASVER